MFKLKSKLIISVVLLLISLGTLHSCISFKVQSLSKTPGFYSGYSKLWQTTQDSILFTNSTLDIKKLKNNGKVYSITGLQLIESLTQIDRAMVYFWAIHCSSESCVPLFVIQQYCKDKNLDLFVIAEYYDDFSEIRLQNTSLDRPLFSINEQFYKTRYCNKYVKLFKKDVFAKQEITKDNISNNYFVFNKGVLTKTMRVLPK